MIDTIVIKEYEQLHIRDKRDITHSTISKADALALQTVIMDDEPVFKWGYKKLIAQHWVGTISLKDLNIEILPKLYGHVSTDDLRTILMRMLILSHQRHRLAVSSVIIAPEELVQQQLYCQTLIISETIGSAGADEACDI